MKKDTIKAIIFDMDGLMFDTEKLYTEGFATVAKTWGYEAEVTNDFIMSLKGKTKAAIKILYKSMLDEKSLKKDGKEFDFVEYLKQVFVHMDRFIESNGMPIKEGLLDLLQFAKENNIKVAIGTSEKAQRVKFYLSKTNLSENDFDSVVCGDMVKNGKPAPDIFLKACKDMSVKPEEVIILEDSISGIIAAHGAGAKPIMVIDCIQPTNEIMNLLYTRPLKSLKEVKGIINW